MIRALPLLLALTACGSGGGLFARGAPDELLSGRQAPLVVPPDYNLAPPAPGAPRPLAPDARTEAMRTLFPDAAPRSAAEQGILEQSGADRADPTARSTAGDPGTTVVDKGAFVKQVIDAPASAGDPAVATVDPQSIR